MNGACFVVIRGGGLKTILQSFNKICNNIISGETGKKILNKVLLMRVGSSIYKGE